MVIVVLAGCAAAEQGAQLEVAAGVVAFQDGVAPSSSYAGTRDTMLEEHDATAKHGADSKLSISGDTPGGSGQDDVALLQWDVSTIPTSAVVTAASLTVTVSDKADQSYGVFEALRAWDESTATWKRASTALNWETNGARGASDRGAQIGAIRAPSTGRITIALDAATVQRWVRDPASNHGVLVASTSNDNRLELVSREGSKASRPRLEVTWQPGGTPAGRYRETCDGSAAIALDATHFASFSDEDQTLRIYTRGSDAAPLQQLDLSAALGMAAGDEADLEDAARLGDRIYAITSHGRTKDGELAPTRHRLAAIDLGGTVPTARFTVAGWTDTLVEDLLDARNWDAPDAALLAQLASATRLDVDRDPDLAPEAGGLNIEGLAVDRAHGDRLVIGLRNPTAGGRAIVVTLLDADAAIAGAPAHFGQALELDLGGFGIRALTWSDALGRLLVLGGPAGDGGPVRLYSWDGVTTTLLQAIPAAPLAAAESLVAYPGTRDVQILFDAGGVLTGSTECKKLATSAQSFTDQVIQLP